ncbi:uncharacterized protein LOC119262015 [Pygocentrus nattereri]|uniref:uncharacterized protein LOC119262015 n=1 Tax=Pygocentrus nattereri TaxID=42514 RepID=UPI001891CB1A|nr:uncharacterized protein LOC119262015 [Pygocentrus nattereri]
MSRARLKPERGWTPDSSPQQEDFGPDRTAHSSVKRVLGSRTLALLLLNPDWLASGAAHWLFALTDIMDTHESFQTPRHPWLYVILKMVITKDAVKTTQNKDAPLIVRTTCLGRDSCRH